MRTGFQPGKMSSIEPAPPPPSPARGGEPPPLPHLARSARRWGGWRRGGGPSAPNPPQGPRGGGAQENPPPRPFVKFLQEPALHAVVLDDGEADAVSDCQINEELDLLLDVKALEAPHGDQATLPRDAINRHHHDHGVISGGPARDCYIGAEHHELVGWSAIHRQERQACAGIDRGLGQFAREIARDVVARVIHVFTREHRRFLLAEPGKLRIGSFLGPQRLPGPLVDGRVATPGETKDLSADGRGRPRRETMEQVGRVDRRADDQDLRRVHREQGVGEVAPDLVPLVVAAAVGIVEHVVEQ